MPKQRINKKMVVDAAFNIAREQGADQVLVRNLADRLGCSVQPIYSYCASIEGVHDDLIHKTGEFITRYMETHVDPDDFLRSTAFAYVKLAQEEPHLFRLFFLRRRPDLSSFSQLYTGGIPSEITERTAALLGISSCQAEKLQLHMIIYIMGISSIMATSACSIPAADICRQIQQAYDSFLEQIRSETG
ncbi:MAG: TetR/AcrR family transcriptional regulator [Emergencia sp.]